MSCIRLMLQKVDRHLKVQLGHVRWVLGLGWVAAHALHEVGQGHGLLVPRTTQCMGERRSVALCGTGSMQVPRGIIDMPTELEPGVR